MGGGEGGGVSSNLGIAWMGVRATFILYVTQHPTSTQTRSRPNIPPLLSILNNSLPSLLLRRWEDVDFLATFLDRTYRDRWARERGAGRGNGGED